MHKAFTLIYALTFSIIACSFNVQAKSLPLMANDQQIDSSFGVSYDFNYDKDNKQKEGINYFFNLDFQHKYKIDKNYNIVFGLFFDYDSLHQDNINDMLFIEFNLNNNNSFTLGKYQDNVKNIIDTTDIFNYSNYDKYDFKHKNTGVITYKYNYGNINTAFAYGTPKQLDEQEHSAYDKNLNSNNQVQKTFSTSLGYKLDLGSLFDLHYGFSYAYNPNLSATNFNSNVHNYTHHAVALTYGTKQSDLYVALMINNRKYNMYKQLSSSSDHSVSGTELVVKRSLSNFLNLALGYEQITMDTVKNSNVNVINVPLELTFNILNNFNIWTQARFNISNKDNNTDSIFKDWNEKFGNFNENSYSAGFIYNF